MYNLANSILADCKAEASLADLETAIYLFREALDRRPAPHPLRSDSLNDLAAALVTRFVQTNQRRDLDEALQLRFEVMSQLRGILERTAGNGSQFQLEVRAISDLMIKIKVHHLLGGYASCGLGRFRSVCAERTRQSHSHEIQPVGSDLKSRDCDIAPPGCAPSAPCPRSESAGLPE